MSQAKRTWIYPKIIKGKLYKYRALLSYLLLALLFTAPFIKMNGEQMILLNVLERKFVFFGVVFWPQDFYLFVLGLLTFIVFIVLFTVVFGRAFCGWICPQTIFLEMVFRRIENWIEGDRIQQQKLDNGPLTGDKILKKLFKHAVFLAISFLIANVFLAYVIGSDSLLTIISAPVQQHISGFISIGIFSIIFYLVFSRMRELVCTVACPYGRLQGVLLDNQTLLVAYDYVRGEPRLKIKKGVDTPHGDCIDCNLCVQVCPTGIDIRNGTQMECVNCTACIDACDMVMEKINRPGRMIGFKSEAEIKTKSVFKVSSRVYGYAAVLIVLIFFVGFLIFNRTPVETTILRASGTLYQLNDANGTVSNLFTAEIVNKTNRTIHFSIIPDNIFAKIQYIEKPDSLIYGGSTKTTFFLILPQKVISNYKTTVSFQIVSKKETIERFETIFIASPNQ
jgi:cytochrome c oxidase accessory protein FixG